MSSQTGPVRRMQLGPSIIVTGIEIAVKASDTSGDSARHWNALGDAKLKQAVESITAAPCRRLTVTPPGSRPAYGGFHWTSYRGQKTTVPVVRITGGQSQKRSRRRAPRELTSNYFLISILLLFFFFFISLSCFSCFASCSHGFLLSFYINLLESICDFEAFLWVHLLAHLLRGVHWRSIA